MAALQGWRLKWPTNLRSTSSRNRRCKHRGPRPTALSIALVVVAILAGVIAATFIVPGRQPDDASPAAGSLTRSHNDASADYADAVKTGKPVYVLFHSLT